MDLLQVLTIVGANGYEKDINHTLNLSKEFRNDPLLWDAVKNMMFHYNKTRLRYAVHTGNLERVKFLLDRNARVDDCLMIAIRNNNLEIVEEFCKHGVNINQVFNNRMTPLIIASESGNLEIVKLLCRYKVDVNFVDPIPLWNALIYATRNGHFQIVVELCRNKANIDQKSLFGVTALMYALEHNHFDIARYLCELGCNVNFINYHNDSALDIALRLNNKQQEMVYLLHSHGA